MKKAVGQMKNYIIKIEVYSNSKHRVKRLINKYKLESIIDGFRIITVEDGGNCVVAGEFIKDIIHAELYISGDDRENIVKAVLDLVQDETVLSWKIISDDEEE